jgi:alpha-1,6-mannosyltransferase
MAERPAAQARVARSELNSRIEAASDAVAPEYILALAAILMVLVYAVAFVRPFGLLRYWRQPLLDLQKMSAFMPLGRWGLLAGFAAQALLYYAGWRAALAARGRLAWSIVIGGGAAAGVVLLFLLPFDAADIFDNIVHGRILGVYNQNPFVAVGAQFPHDPFVPYMAWPGWPSAYGPFWEVLAAVTARLAGNAIVVNVIAFKLLGGLFLGLSVAMVASILSDMAPERALAGTLLLAWNPIVLYETLGHGHNDIVMLFWVLAAVRLQMNRSYTTAIVALLGGALVKFIPVLFVPAAGLLALRDLPDLRSRARFVVVTGLVAAVLVVVAYGVFWHGPGTLTIDRRETMLTTSLPAWVWAWLRQSFPHKYVASDLAKSIGRIAAGLTIVYALWEGVRAWRDRSWLSLARSALHVTLFYLLVTCLWFQNWYAIWPLGLAALFPAGYELGLAQLLGFVTLSKPLLVAPMVFARTPFPNQVWRELRLGPAVLALPWIGALLALAWAIRRGLARHLKAGSDR